MSYFEVSRLSPALAEGYLQAHWSTVDCIGFPPRCAFDTGLDVVGAAAPPPPATASSSAERSCIAPASPNSSVTTADRPQPLQAGMAHLPTRPQMHGRQASGSLAHQQHAGMQQQPPAGLQQAHGQQAQAHKTHKRGGGGSHAARPAAAKDKKHHLLRHSVTEEARRAAVARFCFGEPGRAEDGAASIWKLQQKDLRTAFEAVYGTPTSSCNNGWMRGKLLQALGLSSHWQPPREAPPSPVAPELPPAELEPGAEVSRFGRRVRRRKYEGSDYEESGEETWVEGSPSPRDAAAPGGASAGPSAQLGPGPKRPRASAGSSPRGSPPLGGGPATVVSGSDWRAGMVQPWPAQAGAAGGSAGLASADPNVRIVVRQVPAPREQQRSLAGLQSGPPPPAALRQQQPSEALAFAARFAGSRSASPPLQQAASVPALLPARLPSGALLHAGSAQLPRSLSAGFSGAPPGVLPAQESTNLPNLHFYEQQQRLYLQKRQEWEQEKKREIRQRLAELQGRQAQATHARTSMPPPPAPAAAQPAAASGAAAPPQAAVPPADAPAPVPISSMGHLSAQEWAQHILPPQQQQQQQQGLALHPRGPAYSGPAASPFAALASAGPHQQLLAAATRGHHPGGLAPSLSQELQGLYSAWNDGQLSLHFSGGLH